MKSTLLNRLVAILLVVGLVMDSIAVMGSVGAGFHPRPQSEFHSIQSIRISGRPACRQAGTGGPPLQFLFASQALALIPASIPTRTPDDLYSQVARETTKHLELTPPADPALPVGQLLKQIFLGKAEGFDDMAVHPRDMGPVLAFDFLDHALPRSRLYLDFMALVKSGITGQTEAGEAPGGMRRILYADSVAAQVPADAYAVSDHGLYLFLKQPVGTGKPFNANTSQHALPDAVLMVYGYLRSLGLSPVESRAMAVAAKKWVSLSLGDSPEYPQDVRAILDDEAVGEEFLKTPEVKAVVTAQTRPAQALRQAFQEAVKHLNTLGYVSREGSAALSGLALAAAVGGTHAVPATLPAAGAEPVTSPKSSAPSPGSGHSALVPRPSERSSGPAGHEMVPDHYVARLAVLEKASGKMKTLRFVRADHLQGQERDQAIQSLGRWRSALPWSRVAEIAQALRNGVHETAAGEVKLSRFGLAISEDSGEVEGYVEWSVNPHGISKVHVRPDNESGEKLEGVGPELFAAGLDRVLRLDASRDEPLHLFETLSGGLKMVRRHLPKIRWGEGLNVLITSEEARAWINAQRAQVADLIQRYGWLHPEVFQNVESAPLSAGALVRDGTAQGLVEYTILGAVVVAVVGMLFAGPHPGVAALTILAAVGLAAMSYLLPGAEEAPIEPKLIRYDEDCALKSQRIQDQAKKEHGLKATSLIAKVYDPNTRQPKPVDSFAVTGALSRSVRNELSELQKKLNASLPQKVQAKLAFLDSGVEHLFFAGLGMGKVDEKYRISDERKKFSRAWMKKVARDHHKIHGMLKELNLWPEAVTVTLRPDSAEDLRQLDGLRRDFNQPEFDPRYIYHVSLAYVIADLSEVDVRTIQNALDRLKPNIELTLKRLILWKITSFAKHEELGGADLDAPSKDAAAHVQAGLSALASALGMSWPERLLQPPHLGKLESLLGAFPQFHLRDVLRLLAAVAQNRIALDDLVGRLETNRTLRADLPALEAGWEYVTLEVTGQYDRPGLWRALTHILRKANAAVEGFEDLSRDGKVHLRVNLAGLNSGVLRAVQEAVNQVPDFEMPEGVDRSEPLEAAGRHDRLRPLAVSLTMPKQAEPFARLFDALWNLDHRINIMALKGWPNDEQGLRVDMTLKVPAWIPAESLQWYLETARLQAEVLPIAAPPVLERRTEAAGDRRPDAKAVVSEEPIVDDSETLLSLIERLLGNSQERAWRRVLLSVGGLKGPYARFFTRLFGEPDESTSFEELRQGPLAELREAAAKDPELWEAALCVQMAAQEVWSQANALLGFDETPEKLAFLRRLYKALESLLRSAEEPMEPWSDLAVSMLPHRLAAALPLGRIDEIMHDLIVLQLNEPDWAMSLGVELAVLVSRRADLLDDARELLKRLGNAELRQNFEDKLGEYFISDQVEALIQDIRRRAPPTLDRRGFEELRYAAHCAIEAHLRQAPRDSGEPYMTHPLTVVKILMDPFNITDPLILAVAFAHDVLEDQRDYYVRSMLPIDTTLWINKFMRGRYRDPERMQLIHLGIRMLSEDKELPIEERERRFWRGLREPWNEYPEENYFKYHPGAKDSPEFQRFVRAIQLVKMADRLHNSSDFRSFVMPQAAALGEKALGRPRSVFTNTLDYMLPELVNHPDIHFRREHIEAFYGALTETLFEHARIDLAKYPAAGPLREAALDAMKGLAAGILVNEHYSNSAHLKKLVGRLSAPPGAASAGAATVLGSKPHRLAALEGAA